MKKRGSLNIGRRLESGFALLAFMYKTSKGGKNVSIYDFMPHEERPEASIDDIAAMFGLSAQSNEQNLDEDEAFVKRV